MMILATITAAAWIWGRAIGFSKRLRPNSWNLLTGISITVFALSLWGVEYSSEKQQQSADVITIRVDNSTSITNAWLGHVALREMVEKVDSSADCTSYVRIMNGGSALSQPWISTITPGAFSLNSSGNGQSFSSPTAFSWGQSANANSYDAYFGTSSNPSFTVPPTIAGYYWSTKQTANQPFSCALAGSNFDFGAKVLFPISDMQHSDQSLTLNAMVLIGNGDPFQVVVMNPSGFFTRYNHLGYDFVAGPTPVHLHYQVSSNGSTAVDYSSLGRFFRSNSPPIQVLWTAPDNYEKSLIFWMSVFGMIVSPISTILTLVLTWISLHRRRAEGILLRLEVEKQKLEIEKLRLEVERMRLEPTRQTASLLIVPG